jgi:hypothetical protein
LGVWLMQPVRTNMKTKELKTERDGDIAELLLWFASRAEEACHFVESFAWISSNN